LHPPKIFLFPDPKNPGYGVGGRWSVNLLISALGMTFMPFLVRSAFIWVTSSTLGFSIEGLMRGLGIRLWNHVPILYLMWLRSELTCS